MNRRTLFAVAVAAATTFVAPFAPSAYAADHHHGDDRHDHRGHDHDRGRDRERHRGDRHDHDHDHDHDRHARYVVRYHVDGGSGRHKAKDRDRAAWIVDLLRDIGVDAHVHDRREVHFTLRGERRAFFRAHEDAHLLAKRLDTYGFHARVEHR